VQQTCGDIRAPLHATGKRFDAIVSTLLQANHVEGAIDLVAKTPSAKPVQSTK
jgi:hypothetical protein